MLTSLIHTNECRYLEDRNITPCPDLIIQVRLEQREQVKRSQSKYNALKGNLNPSRQFDLQAMSQSMSFRTKDSKILSEDDDSEDEGTEEVI